MASKSMRAVPLRLLRLASSTEKIRAATRPPPPCFEPAVSGRSAAPDARSARATACLTRSSIPRVRSGDAPSASNLSLATSSGSSLANVAGSNDGSAAAALEARLSRRPKNSAPDPRVTSVSRACNSSSEPPPSVIFAVNHGAATGFRAESGSGNSRTSLWASSTICSVDPAKARIGRRTDASTGLRSTAASPPPTSVTNGTDLGVLSSPVPTGYGEPA